MSPYDRHVVCATSLDALLLLHRSLPQIQLVNIVPAQLLQTYSFQHCFRQRQQQKYRRVFVFDHPVNRAALLSDVSHCTDKECTAVEVAEQMPSLLPWLQKIQSRRSRDSPCIIHLNNLSPLGRVHVCHVSKNLDRLVCELERLRLDLLTHSSRPRSSVAKVLHTLFRKSQ